MMVYRPIEQSVLKSNFPVMPKLLRCGRNAQGQTRQYLLFSRRLFFEERERKDDNAHIGAAQMLSLKQKHTDAISLRPGDSPSKS